MMDINFDLTVIWACIIAFAVAAYVVMDGFDLGIGILFPRLPVGEERNKAMNSIAPVWDGNETWLVLGGEGCLRRFRSPIPSSCLRFTPPSLPSCWAWSFVALHSSSVVGVWGTAVSGFWLFLSVRWWR